MRVNRSILSLERHKSFGDQYTLPAHKQCSPAEQAEPLNLGYSTVARWVRQFREKGMPGLFPVNQYPRGPDTSERVIVALLYFKCCAPKASYFELSRVVAHTIGPCTA
jgi:transposase